MLTISRPKRHQLLVKPKEENIFFINDNDDTCNILKTLQLIENVIFKLKFNNFYF